MLKSMLKSDRRLTCCRIVNVVTDFAILALPIQPVLGLKMRTRRKIQVLSIFLLGGMYVAPLYS